MEQGHDREMKRLRQRMALSIQAYQRAEYDAAVNAKLARRAAGIAVARRIHRHVLENHVSPAVASYLLRFKEPLDPVVEKALLAAEETGDFNEEELLEQAAKEGYGAGRFPEALSDAEARNELMERVNKKSGEYAYRTMALDSGELRIRSAELVCDGIAYNAIMHHLFDMEPENVHALLRFADPLEVVRDQVQARLRKHMEPLAARQLEEIAQGGVLLHPDGEQGRYDLEEDSHQSFIPVMR